MTRVILVRHGESVANAANQIAGDPEAPLREEGTLQAKTLGDFLRPFECDVVVSSDRPRALGTARYGLLKRRIQQLQQLCERDWGDLAVLQDEGYRAQLKAIGVEFYEFVPPGGESFLCVEERIRFVIEKLFDAHRERLILLVPHESVNKCELKILLNLTSNEFEALRQPNACVNDIKVDKTRRARAEAICSVEHLLERAER